MALIDDFKSAAANVQQLPKRPSDNDLLELYALYKQATDGDVTGSRPGFLDIKGRKKFDSWAEKKGTTKEAAMTSYIALVTSLAAKG